VLRINRLSFLVCLQSLAIIIIMAFFHPTSVSADAQHHTEQKCVVCHEDLYLLHDKGNWFCLKESPMTCTDCHGGNPDTTTKADAHARRTPYPIVNGDISKCQQCHPEKSFERVSYFDQNAGISDIAVAIPYTPNGRVPVGKGAEPQQTEEKPTNMWFSIIGVSSILLMFFAVPAIYFALRWRHVAKEKS